MMKKNIAAHRSGTLFSTLIKVIITSALNYGPAGVISWLLRSVSRKPLRWVLAILLEPLLRRGFGVVFGRFAKEKHETTAK
ncbi:phage shock protein PspD [Yersinia ruckeri]|uniref:phage shock protein PspD n=1 Tax=Yersinia ruckeri TaxID=29486 RepID=UPI0004E2B225|nr:phage shock protein PspD [Yersinia ruckeri]ARZ00963.1 Phage shock protein D [Yersinia ruckeri]AUQ43048.1 phage shock protein D [Yersinia ruckeri]EKN4181295.1 phage shock protein PspD [Yersinia ruckeri]EKN4196799.1 phage shock protein PspD [Yersinia ruckeri]EKN4203453.1 phage shock protein PspD [Yersinia ruckeri]